MAAAAGTVLIEGPTATVLGAFAGSGRTAAFDTLGARSTVVITAGWAAGWSASAFADSAAGCDRSGAGCLAALAPDFAPDFASTFADSVPSGMIDEILLFSMRM